MVYFLGNMLPGTDGLVVYRLEWATGKGNTDMYIDLVLETPPKIDVIFDVMSYIAVHNFNPPRAS